MRPITKLLFLMLIATVLPDLRVIAETRIDRIRYDAPELAAYGAYAIGVRTLDLVNPNQIDIVKLDPAQPKPDPLPRYDRPLKVEIWYPAEPGSKGSTALKALIRDGKTEALLHGKAVRDAAPAKEVKALPLVIISHGFPGNRFLLSPLAENIASKGYVVVSIDHIDSTYDTQSARGFASTLVNRSRDQHFVLDRIAALSRDPSFFLKGKVDANNSAVIGYSMGGYGALLTAGAAIAPQAISSPDPIWTAPFGLLAQQPAFDPRVKTVIAFAPAGWSKALFDAESLKGLKPPMLFVAGSLDDVVGYDTGVRPTWAAASSIDRALLTFENGGHNSAPLIPAPEEADKFDQQRGFNLLAHYVDSVWDPVRLDNISEHFVTAWLGKYLKSDPAMDAYLEAGPWKGFPEKTAKGLRFETLKAGR
jgi:predicted dienelactone hydrolase